MGYDDILLLLLLVVVVVVVVVVLIVIVVIEERRLRGHPLGCQRHVRCSTEGCAGLGVKYNGKSLTKGIPCKGNSLIRKIPCTRNPLYRNITTTASGRSRDKRGRRGSVAIPHDRLSWENVAGGLSVPGSPLH